MHIEYFNYFYKVAKVKSISKVAKSIHISQSALSQQIQKLEDSLGYKLLERSNKGVNLTEMGEIVLKYSENIINTYSKMLEELEGGSETTNLVRLEACHSVSHYALPCSLYKVKEKYSYHKYELFTNTSKVIKENVINNISDIGFVYKNTKEKELQYHKVGVNKFVLTASSYFDIPQVINVEEFLSYPIITMSGKEEMIETVENNLIKLGHTTKELNILFQLDSIEAIKSSINRRHGLAFLPYISIKEELYKKQFKSIQVDNFALDLPVYMINKKSSSVPKAVKEFIEYFKIIGEKSFC